MFKKSITCAITVHLLTMPGRKKDYPCLKCNNHVKKNDKAVQCTLCDQWIHKECENMDDETFDVLARQVDNLGGTFWNCKSCRTFAAKFDKRMKEMDRRLVTVEETVESHDTDIASIKADIKKVQQESKAQKENEGVIQENAATAVFSEMRERDFRKCNVLIHGIAEQHGV